MILFLLSSVALAAPASTPVPFATKHESAPKAVPLGDRVTHLLNRLAFGPRPGEEEKLRAGGQPAMRAWIQAQLHAETIADESVEKKLKALPAIAMSSAQLLAAYPRIADVAKNQGIDKGKLKDDKGIAKELKKEIGKDHLPPHILEEMASAKTIRAVESRRQLQELLFDFWFNHFNVDFSKGQEKWLLPPYERLTLRPHLFGKFRDLLGAVAHSPAMLFYLDNQLSHSANAPKGPNAKATGLNENYARELLELHTLGVQGGYTQADVTELARILTGWSIEDPKLEPAFKFRPRFHDSGEKKFLGQVFPAGHAEDEGDRALDLLAKSPSTARFLSEKLCRYFVADEPPPALVKRVAEKFRATEGDLRATYEAIFASPEFWDSSGGKIKRPFQLMASAVRALGGEVEIENGFRKNLAAMGEEPYRCAPPTGYHDDARTWVNPGSLVSRLSFAVKLAENQIPGAYCPLPRLEKAPASSTALIDAVSQLLMHRPLSSTSRKVAEGQFADENQTMADGEVRPLSLVKAVGLVLGSPDFQRR